MKAYAALLTYCVENMKDGFPLIKASNVKLVTSNKLPMIWDAMTLMWCHCNDVLYRTSPSNKHAVSKQGSVCSSVASFGFPMSSFWSSQWWIPAMSCSHKQFLLRTWPRLFLASWLLCRWESISWNSGGLLFQLGRVCDRPESLESLESWCVVQKSALHNVAWRFWMSLPFTWINQCSHLQRVTKQIPFQYFHNFCESPKTMVAYCI